MIIPQSQGTCTQQSYFIFTACDSGYFDQFGSALINSVLNNTNLGLHLHLFNPRDDQITHCSLHSRVSVTHEQVDQQLFTVSAARWATEPNNPLEKSYLDRTVNAMGKGNDRDILERMQKTYYACARFFRLAEIFTAKVPVLSIDVDAVVRKQPPLLPASSDIYLHKITGKKARILAGGMMLHPTTVARKFITEYSDLLKSKFAQDYVYWGLDQDLLDTVVPRYNHGHLPIEYIDWHMSPSTYIWTAKGTRKDDAVFVNEKQKYTA